MGMKYTNRLSANRTWESCMTEPSSPARKHENVLLTVGAVEEGNRISKDVLRRALDVSRLGRRAYRAKMQSLGGWSPQLCL